MFEKSHDYRDVFVFEKLFFLNVFHPHENLKASVLKFLRFEERFRNIFPMIADFVVSFSDQIVIKASFRDINVGTMKWIRVEPHTSVDWILKKVQ